jgi:hypothetical protein
MLLNIHNVMTCAPSISQGQAFSSQPLILEVTHLNAYEI